MQTLSSSFHPPRPLCQIKTASKEVEEEEDPSKAKLVVNDHLTKLVVRKIRRFKY